MPSVVASAAEPHHRLECVNDFAYKSSNQVSVSEMKNTNHSKVVFDSSNHLSFSQNQFAGNHILKLWLQPLQNREIIAQSKLEIVMASMEHCLVS